VAVCVETVDTIEPEPEWVEVYAPGYERFRALYPALRGLEG
jgi:sugar (pentulose or hexulose) kinase